MPSTVNPADIQQDRQLAVLLELALTLPVAGREAGLRAAGASARQMVDIIRLLASEPGSAGFLDSPVQPARQLKQQRWCSGDKTLIYTPDGPMLAARA